MVTTNSIATIVKRTRPIFDVAASALTTLELIAILLLPFLSSVPQQATPNRNLLYCACSAIIVTFI